MPPGHLLKILDGAVPYLWYIPSQSASMHPLFLPHKSRVQSPPASHCPPGAISFMQDFRLEIPVSACQYFTSTTKQSRSTIRPPAVVGKLDSLPPLRKYEYGTCIDSLITLHSHELCGWETATIKAYICCLFSSRSCWCNPKPTRIPPNGRDWLTDPHFRETNSIWHE
jgi:hypothetical protein